MIGIRNMIEAKNIMECIIETINMPFFLPKNKQSHFVTISLPQIVNNRQIIGIRSTFILDTIKQIYRHSKLMSVLLADGLIAKWFRASTFSVRVSLDRRFDSGRTLKCQISLKTFKLLIF